MARLPFEAQVDEWVRQSQQRMEAVFKTAASEVIEEMQKVGPSKSNPAGAGGNMPVDTGFLRASLVVAINAELPAANRPHPGGESYSASPVDMVIAGAELGDTIVAGYTANYAGHVNYGTSRMAPRQFVERAAQQWPTIVGSVTARLLAS